MQIWIIKMIVHRVLFVHISVFLLYHCDYQLYPVPNPLKRNKRYSFPKACYSLNSIFGRNRKNRFVKHNHVCPDGFFASICVY